MAWYYIVLLLIGTYGVVCVGVAFFIDAYYRRQNLIVMGHIILARLRLLILFRTTERGMSKLSGRR
jgi:hypothetical protein